MKDRPYKEALPKSTISNIKRILSDIDMLVVPAYWGNPYDKIHSVRIEAIDEDGGFGTNGKGRSQLYALASAYAEFIERIQNQLLAGDGFSKTILDVIFHSSGFYYFPDERPLTLEDFMKLPKDILSDLFGIKSEVLKNEFVKIFDRPYIKKRGGIISVPFYNVTKNKETFLPYNLLYLYTGSNGMASGNTIAEATFQAFCEIFERHAASIIYYDRLTPPTIAKEFLARFPDEFNVISEIENNGFDVVVKDFSCNLGLPVVGLIIIDKANKRYRLNVGSDTSFKVALSRTLTEIHQGFRGMGDFEKVLLSLPNEENASFFYDENQKMELEVNLTKFMKNGLGYFPPSLFLSKSSYEFKPDTFHPKESYEEEVKSLFSLGKSIGYDIFIRDVSFLGFPTVYIYIPNVSIVGRKNLPVNKLMTTYLNKFDELDSLIFPFEDLIYNREKMLNVIDIVEKMCGHYDETVYLQDLLHLDFKIKTPWKGITVNFFMSLVCYLVAEYDKAIYYLQIFLKETNNVGSSYYGECISYFELLRDQKPTNSIDHEIIDGFKDPLSLFKYINFPNCPDCKNCKLSTQCVTRIKIGKALKINDSFSKAIINQNKFRVYS